MTGNIFNTPIQKSLTNTSQKSVNDNNQILGQNLPCHVVSVNGSIVTVAFDILSDYTLPQVTMPVFGFEYIRYPIKIGDKGVAISSSARVAGNSGLSQGISDLSLSANLASLIFMPIGNINWSSVDHNALVMYGINGAVIRDTESNSIITLTPESITIVSQNSVTISTGGTSAQFNSDGSFNISGNGAGVISASGGLTLSDGVNSAIIANMQVVFASMISWMNLHTHEVPAVSAEAIATDTPYVGGNPIS